MEKEGRQQQIVKEVLNQIIEEAIDNSILQMQKGKSTNKQYQISYSFKYKFQILTYLQSNQEHCKDFQNILFYSDLVQITYQKVTLSKIHQNKAKDYKWLEQRHDYIQWLFPNHFASQFNSQSYPLGYIQAEIFKTDIQLGYKVLRSFEIYLDFMGCQIKYYNKKDKQQILTYHVSISQLKNYLYAQKRLLDVLLVNTHNHLRIMRILACLSVLGFRLIALEFINFLIRLSEEHKIFKKNGLKEIVDHSWIHYAERNEKQKKKALEMCFIKGNNFPDHHQALLQKCMNDNNKVHQKIQQYDFLKMQDF